MTSMKRHSDEAISLTEPTGPTDLEAIVVRDSFAAAIDDAFEAMLRLSSLATLMEVRFTEDQNRTIVQSLGKERQHKLDQIGDDL